MKSREKMDKKSPTNDSRSAKTSGIGMSTGMAAPTVPKMSKMSEEMRYRAEQDMGTLHRAHQIITDKSRHAAVKQHAAEVFAAAQAPGISVSRKGRK